MRGLYRYLSFLTALAAASVSSADSLECLSPDGRLKVRFESDGKFAGTGPEKTSFFEGELPNIRK